MRNIILLAISICISSLCPSGHALAHGESIPTDIVDSVAKLAQHAANEGTDDIDRDKTLSRIGKVIRTLVPEQRLRLIEMAIAELPQHEKLAGERMDLQETEGHRGAAALAIGLLIAQHTRGTVKMIATGISVSGLMYLLMSLRRFHAIDERSAVNINELRSALRSLERETNMQIRLADLK